ncbi:GTPase IMAP member 7 [Bulinus truncatus]|nr:GTPase IMAP member 7 [Bulinus truncatus]
MERSAESMTFKEKSKMFHEISRPQSGVFPPDKETSTRKTPPPVPPRGRSRDESKCSTKTDHQTNITANPPRQNVTSVSDTPYIIEQHRSLQADVKKGECLDFDETNSSDASKLQTFVTVDDPLILKEDSGKKALARKTDSTLMQPEYTQKLDRPRSDNIKETKSTQPTMRTPSRQQISLEEEVRRREEEMFNTPFTDFEIPDRNRSSNIGDHALFPKASPDQIDLLLIGKTGNGKSSLGNAILGQYAFESKPSQQSVTKNVTYDVSETHGVRIKVVDGPGVGDTRMDTLEATHKILEAMSKSISLSPQGYHAFLLVIKFGVRFTAEEKETVVTLKKIFGEHFFKRFFIIIMTCGDKFDEEVKTDFKAWVEEQNNGIFDEHFTIATVTRNSLIVEAEKELLEEEIINEANLIQQRLQYILSNVQCHKSTPFLADILERANELYKRIKDKDKGTGVLHDLAQHVWSLLNSIRDQKKLSEYMKETTEKFNKRRKKEKKRYAEDLKFQREVFENYCLEGREKEERKNEMLQKQIEEINKKEEFWRKENEEWELKKQAAWDGEQQKVQIFGEDLKNLKEKQVRLTEEKVSISVFARLKRKFFSKKSDSEQN